MKFIVLSLRNPSSVPPRLAPAPSARDAEHTSTILRNDQTPPITNLFEASPITVLDDYRGHLLYCAGGVTVHRYNPQTTGGHGYAGAPSDGLEEDVFITTRTDRYSARIKFVQ